MRSCLLIACLASLALPVVAQRTWTVDEQNRPGTDFTNLPQAVATVARGDVLFVRDGNYSPVTISRSLTLRGEGVPTGGLTGCSVDVVNLPPGDLVLLQTLRFVAFGNATLRFQQCRGQIHVEDIGCDGILDATDCDHIAVVGGYLAGRYMPHTVTRSNLTLDGVSVSCLNWGAVQATLMLQQSTVRAVRTSLLGGNGTEVCIPGCNRGLWPFPAVYATNSTLVFGPGCVVEGNYHVINVYGGGGPNNYTWQGCLGPSIQGTGSTVVGNPTIRCSGLGSVPVTVRVIADGACTAVVRGRTATASLVAGINQPAALFASLPLPTWVPSGFGEILCDPRAVATLGVGVTDGQGLLPAPLPVSIHLPLGSLVVVQGIVLDAQGRLQASFAAQRCVRDP